MDVDHRLAAIEAGADWLLALTPRAAKLRAAAAAGTASQVAGQSGLLTPTGAAVVAHRVLSTKNRKAAKLVAIDPDPGVWAALQSRDRQVSARLRHRTPDAYAGLAEAAPTPLDLHRALGPGDQGAFDLVLVDTLGAAGQLVPLWARAHAMLKPSGVALSLLHPGLRACLPVVVERAGLELLEVEHERIPRMLRGAYLTDAHWDVVVTRRAAGAQPWLDGAAAVAPGEARGYDPPHELRAFFDTAPVPHADAASLRAAFERFAAAQSLTVVASSERVVGDDVMVFVSFSDGSVGASTFVPAQQTVATTRTPSTVAEMFALVEALQATVEVGPVFHQY